MRLHQCASILQADMDVLLRRRDDLVFSRTLERRQLGDGFGKDSQHLGQFGVANDERRCQPDDVFVRRLGLNDSQSEVTG